MQWHQALWCIFSFEDVCCFELSRAAILLLLGLTCGCWKRHRSCCWSQTEGLWEENEAQFNAKCKWRTADGFKHVNSSCCFDDFELSLSMEKLRLCSPDLGFSFVWRRTDCSLCDWQYFVLEKKSPELQLQGAQPGRDWFLSYCFVYLVQPCYILCIVIT